jgi:PD-(D/E)XK nuclease superfamily protein
MRERLINRRQQGDLGEASAIEWFTRLGAVVAAPLGHSPDYDLVVEHRDRLIRVQVKTSVCTTRTPAGHERHCVQVATLGGNQSWTGVVRKFDSSRADALFILSGDGRRWLIPAHAVEGATSINVGGQKYSEFEIERGFPLAPLVYGLYGTPLESTSPQGVYPSGQRTAPVKRQAHAFAGSNPAAPITSRRVDRPRFERTPARSGQTILGAKRRLGIPVGPFDEANLSIGDRMRVCADGPGRVVLERIDPQRDSLSSNGQPQLDLG